MTLHDTFLLDIQSYQWWISVVLVGVAIHVLSEFIKPLIVKKVIPIIKSFHSSFKPDNEITKRELEALKNSEVKQIALAISEMRHRFLGFFYCV